MFLSHQILAGPSADRGSTSQLPLRRSANIPEHTSFDPQSSFAPGLIEFIRDVATHHQHLPILAVCFGHQIAALALGGECVRGSNGWEIGVYSNNFTKEGRYWWSDYVVEDGADKIYVEQMVSPAVDAA